MFSHLKSFNDAYLNAFKNPNKRPINDMYLEQQFFELNNDFSGDVSDVEYRKFCEVKLDVIPALDKRWLPKVCFHDYEPYDFSLSPEENEGFIDKNTMFNETLVYLLKCNFHVFWCTIVNEPGAVKALQSFLQSPVGPGKVQFLRGEFLEVHKAIFGKFCAVWMRLLQLKESEDEFLSEPFWIKTLLDKKLLNLSHVLSLSLLYKNSHKSFVNSITNIYFNELFQTEFNTKEIDFVIEQSIVILQSINESLKATSSPKLMPLSIGLRPKVFNPIWYFKLAEYLFDCLSNFNTLLQLNENAIDLVVRKGFHVKIPFLYVNIYKNLYEILDQKDFKLNKELFEMISLSRQEFVDLFHVFVTTYLNKTLELIGNDLPQEETVEDYINLMTTALEEEFFICDYDERHKVAVQNEMFESCANLDQTRTQFITDCINKHQRHKRLQEASKLNRKTLEEVFKEFKPFEEIEMGRKEPLEVVPAKQENSESLISEILDLFPHLGDAFVLKCLESYSFNKTDVINAILENNLPPHLASIPFDEVRDLTEEVVPTLQYKGKKPEPEDALDLLNDKTEVQHFKNYILEEVQYNNNYVYDDEYDDRYDDDNVKIRVGVAEDPSSSSSEEEPEPQEEASSATGFKAFCEDPAVIRARREAQFRSKRGGLGGPPQREVVGKAKGQGQDQAVLRNRQKKNTNKSTRANHNRKGGAQFKQSKGMF